MLNDAVVRNAGPGIIWDSTLKGFGLRTGKQTKTFIVLVGSGRRKRIGRYPLMTVAAARDRARQMLAQKVLGSISPKHVAFEDAVRDYLEDCAKRMRPGPVYQYAWLLGRLDFGRKSIGDITGTHMLRVLNAQTPSNKEHLFRAARTFWQWAFRNHLIDRSPMERLDAPPNGNVRERVLTDEELGKVYSVACRASNPVHRLVWLLCRTGQRPGEIRRLQRDWVASDRITCPAHIAKNGREHVYPISKETYEFIQAIPQFDGSPYLFPPSKLHLKRKPVNDMAPSHVEVFKRECDIAPWQLRDLRKTFATGLEKLGVRQEVTEAFLNHVKAGIVGVYQRHRYFPEMQEALGLWERHLTETSSR